MSITIRPVMRSNQLRPVVDLIDTKAMIRNPIPRVTRLMAYCSRNFLSTLPGAGWPVSTSTCVIFSKTPPSQCPRFTMHQTCTPTAVKNWSQPSTCGPCCSSV